MKHILIAERVLSFYGPMSVLRVLYVLLSVIFLVKWEGSDLR